MSGTSGHCLAVDPFCLTWRARVSHGDRVHQVYGQDAVREIRELGLRPGCGCCKAGAVKLTVGLKHESGEELQLTGWSCR